MRRCVSDDQDACARRAVGDLVGLGAEEVLEHRGAVELGELLWPHTVHRLSSVPREGARCGQALCAGLAPSSSVLATAILVMTFLSRLMMSEVNGLVIALRIGGGFSPDARSGEALMSAREKW